MKRLFSTILVILSFINLYSAILPPISSGVYTNPALMLPINTTDPRYGDYASNWFNQFNNINVKNRIVFKIDRDAHRHITRSGDIIINFTVNYNTYIPNSVGTPAGTLSQSVTLHYDTAYLGKEKDEVTVVIDNVVNSSLVINSVSYPIGVPYPASLGNPFIIVENIIDIERVEKFDYNASPAPIQIIGVNNNSLGRSQFIRMSWASPVLGAEGYELEYMFINNYNYNPTAFSSIHGITQFQANPSNYSYNFRNNSTRIFLEGAITSYEIPNIFPDGFIIARVRAVGKDLLETDEWLQGTWTLGENGVIDLIFEESVLRAYRTTSPARSTSSPYESMNSMTSLVFSEGGRIGSSISYFDGTLRSRETIVYSKTTEQFAVSQTIFDYLGREAVKALPSIAMDDLGFTFRAAFNKSSLTGNAYSYNDFDLNQINSDEIKVDSMLNTSGASKYYSPNLTTWISSLSSLSPAEKQMHSFVPDAKGYPFMQTEFTRDPTGRTIRTGGVGKTMQLYSYSQNNNLQGGHETYTWDATPFQEELDVLFGNEVGFAEKYKKIMTRDPNGQLSIAYMDPYGRTVATALAGLPSDAPSLDPLTSSSHSLSYMVILPNTEEDISTGKKIIKHHFLVTSKDTWKFYYQYEVPKFNIPCDTSLCFTCGYTLTMSLKDVLGKEKFPIGTPNKQFVGNPIPENGACNGKQTFSINPNPIELVLEPGEYVLTKVLEIDANTRDSFRSKWLEKATCGKTFEDFLEDEKEEMNLNCDIGCEDCRIEQLKIGHIIDSLKLHCSENNIDTADFDPLWAAKEEYNQIKDICDNICLDKTPCDLLYDAIVQDLTPGGQYAKYSIPGWDGNDSLTIPNNTLNEGSIFQGVDPKWWCNTVWPSYFNYNYNLPVWKQPLNSDKPLNLRYIYLDAEGKEALIEVKDGQPLASQYVTVNGKTYARPHELIYYTDFIKYHEASWVNSLLYYHPEYCYLRKCRAINESYIYDNLLLKTYSSADAIKKGFYNPLGMTYNSGDTITVNGYNRQINYNSNEVSPVLRDPVLGKAFLNINDLKTRLRNIELNCNSGIKKSFWQLYERERANYGLDEHDTCTDNLFWPLLRAHYLQQKREWLNTYYNDSCPTGTRCGNQVGGIRFRHFLINNSSNLAWENANDDDIVKKDRWNSENGCDPGQVQSKIDDQIKDYCATKCANNAEMWMLKLADCNKISALSLTQKNALKADLAKLCESGCDLDNPYGSVTRSPNVSTTTYPEANLAEVFKKHLGNDWFVSGICDDLLIDFPGEYGHDYLSTDDPEADTCACSNKKEVPENTRCPENAVDSIALEDCACDKTPKLKQELLSTMQIDDEKKCKTCISCEDLQDPVREFLEKYNPNEVSDSILYQKLLTTWLNRKFKFNLTYNEYQNYAYQCIDTLTNVSWVAVWEQIGIDRLVADNNHFDFNNLFELEEEYTTLYQAAQPIELKNNRIENTWNIEVQNKYHNNSNQYNQWLMASIDDFYYPIQSEVSLISSADADKIACHCEKVLNVYKLLPNPYTNNDALNLYNKLYLPETLPCQPNYSFDDIKNMCSKMWNMEPSSPGFSDPNNFTEGDKFNIDQKYHIDQQIQPNPTGVLACLTDGNCNPTPEIETEKDYLDTCSCNLLKSLKDQWLAAGGLGSGLNYEQFIFQQTGVTITPSPSADNLLNECDNFIKSDFEKDEDGNTADWTLGQNFWSNVSNENLTKYAENKNLMVPKPFKCIPGPQPPDPPVYHPDPCMDFKNCATMGQLIIDYLSSNPLPSGFENLANHTSQCSGDDDVLNNAWKLLGSSISLGSNNNIYKQGYSQTQINEFNTWNSAFQSWFIGQNYKCSPIPPHIDMFTFWRIYATCRKGCPENPKPIVKLPIPKCTNCYALDTPWIKAFVKYNNQILSKPSNTGVSRLVNSKWWMYSSIGSNSNNNIPEFYNSIIYENRLFKGDLRYNVNEFKHPYIRIQIPDKNGYVLDYSMEYLTNENHLNFGEIVKFKNPRGIKQQGCEPLQYFYVDVEQRVFEKYWGIDGCPNVYTNGVPIGCVKTFTLLVRVNTKNVLKKVPCLSCAKLCNKPFVRPNIQIADECEDDELHTATQNALLKYNDYLIAQARLFDSLYNAKCFEAKDTFRLKYKNTQYHYTLYYYDRAGNLTKTVPPEGVDIDNNTLIANHRQILADNRIIKAAAHRKNNALNKAITYHSLITNYRYNSINQLVWQNTPDGGVSRFWYDQLGRIVVSQNAKQSPTNKYSYTTFDALGRMEEVGEISPSGMAPNISPQVASTPLDLASFLDVSSNLVSKTNVTRTFYDLPANISRLGSIFGSGGQQNLRNRIATVTYEKINDGNNATYNHASYYSYDIHGNVFKLVQDIAGLDMLDFNLFTMDYNYDLLSGKVNSVDYQKNKLDQLSHKYYYDMDNKLTNVESSRDGYNWETDAKYWYYLHGPLARKELGNLQVQGLDYAYTLQGWIKSVNSGTLEADHDMGRDGSLLAYPMGGLNPNKMVARDAMGFYLSYFEHDYQSVSSQQASPSIDPNSFNNKYRNLYNGNIAHMGTVLPNATTYQMGTPNNSTLGNVYHYDQLNRITKHHVFDHIVNLTNNWPITTFNGDDKHYETFTYDANGNITGLTRNGHNPLPTTAMDDLNYHYDTEVKSVVIGSTIISWTALISNKLYHVNDNVNLSNYLDDIDDQGGFNNSNVTTSNNYTFDEIGNLKTDNAEQIQEIKWNVYGKIESIIRANGSLKPDLEFGYSADGQRLYKLVKPKDNMGNIKQELDWISTWYVRDATGNVMATYIKKMNTTNIPNQFEEKLYAKEWYVYGSERLATIDEKNILMSNRTFTFYGTSQNGSWQDRNYTTSATVSTITSAIYTLTRGYKTYELSNHLGNVLATVQDRKQSIDINANNLTDYYLAYLSTITDYYCFGSVIPNRTKVIEDDYRYGFNGEEINKVSEGMGGGGSTYDYGFRIYNPNIVRFLSVDPLERDYPWYTPYQFAGNMPIWAIDLDGLEPLTSNEDANKRLDEFATSTDETDQKSNWSQMSKIEFINAVRELLSEQGACINQSNNTNFCGKAATAFSLGFKDNPLGMTNFLIDLYLNGSATYDNLTQKVTITLSDELKNNFKIDKIIAPENTTYGTDKEVKVNPAFALLGAALSEKYNWGLDKKYDEGDENSIWASATLGVEKDIVGDFFGYEFESVGSNFRGLFKNKELKKLINGVDNGKIVITLVNSAVLHDSKQAFYKTLIGTHWIVLLQNSYKWEYAKFEKYDRKKLKKSLAGGLIINKATGHGH